MNYKFIIQAPFWFYILSLGIAIGYAWLLYRNTTTWSRHTRILLAVLRAVLVFSLLVIVSEPLLRQSQQDVEKPVVAVLVDNSSSVAAHTPGLSELLHSLQAASKELPDDKTYVFYTLKDKVSPDSIKDIKFNQTKTNIQTAFKNIEEDLEGQNIAAIALLSDGNYNQGTNPTFMDYKYPVYTLGLGDTVSKKDLNISHVRYNKNAYLGNKFIITYKLKNTGYAGEQTSLILKEKDQVLYTKDLKIERSKGEQSANIVLDAKKEGIMHLVLSCTKKEGEYSYANNEVHLYIEVIKEKDKVLILASAPHPDVKAVNAALASGENYEVEAHFIGDGAALNLANINAVVLLGIPNKRGIGNDIYADIKRKSIPCLYILQAGADLNRVSSDAKSVELTQRSSEMDKVQASLNSRFESFSTSELDAALISQYPPLNVPFANYEVATGTEILLYQKVGSSVTMNPLWALGKGASAKNAVILGDGLWMWRIHEKSKTENSDNFDAMMMKTLQFIASKADKRKFKVTPTAQEYEEGDLVAMNTEVYDNLDQLSYGQEVQLQVYDEGGKEFKYKYVNQEHQERFELGQFPQGSYRYVARTSIAGKAQSYGGAFNIKKLQLEELTAEADRAMLKELSLKTKAEYYEKSELKALVQRLGSTKAVGKVSLRESFRELINLKWLFVVLLLLVSIEWILRKYYGGY